MEPIVNLDETPGKTVGKRRSPADGLALTDAQRAEAAIAWQRALGGLKVARGIYRFRTHEEADAWLWEKMTNSHR
jgi:hypothetical protein